MLVKQNQHAIQLLIFDFHSITDGLISMVDFLSNHMQNVIEQKEKVIQHLHEPFVGKPLAIDAEYHR